MTIKKKYSGVVVPMVSPFTDSGEVDKSAVAKITEHLVAEQTSPFVLGTTGEAASIPLDQKVKLVSEMVRVTNKRELTYAGIDSTCFQTSVEMARQFADLGVDAVVAHLPEYYPLTPEHMLNYFEKLADASPVPLIVYNIPGTTGMSIPLDVLETLSKHSNIAGLKDSERDPERLEKCLSLWKENSEFSFLIGWAAQSTYALFNGADGIVPSTGNLVPGMYCDLYQAAIKGDQDQAEPLQQITNDISLVYQKDRILSQSLAALKACMHSLGLCENAVLPPLLALSLSETQNIEIALKELMNYREE